MPANGSVGGGHTAQQFFDARDVPKDLATASFRIQIWFEMRNSSVAEPISESFISRDWVEKIRQESLPQNLQRCHSGG
jgi:hypothetical protein